MNTEQSSSFETLQQIRSIMERAARLLSLSGWSGIWAGGTALCSAFIVHRWLQHPTSALAPAVLPFVYLAVLTFAVAFAGAFFFTYRKNKKERISMWNHASKKMLINLGIPLAAGALLIAAFLLQGHFMYVVPAMLLFYGLALINGSKYTISDIKYLGLLELVLGGAALFLKQEYALYIWALGFGLLHIVYGILMWRK